MATTLSPAKLEQAVRMALSSERRKELMDLMGWDSSDVSRILSNQQGIPLNKIDLLTANCGFALVTKPYLDAISTLCQVGASCHCAREGFGECGSGVRGRP
ncbi:DNA-binding protein [Cupriavidus sp. Agwp_2]|uniref:DNA-binding protein n=1 Tax=Cupriavidus sp. Agwp_2 TaxID=2897324 RepID=UPI003460A1F9